jgi:hypothetical protein
MGIGCGINIQGKGPSSSKGQNRPLGRPTPFSDMAKWACVLVVLQLEMWNNIMRLAHEKLIHFGVC